MAAGSRTEAKGPKARLVAGGQSFFPPLPASVLRRAGHLVRETAEGGPGSQLGGVCTAAGFWRISPLHLRWAVLLSHVQGPLGGCLGIDH